MPPWEALPDHEGSRRLQSISSVSWAVQMSRYYFDIVEDDQVAPDEEGIDLPDLVEARREAVHSLADIARELVVDGADEPRQIVVRVRDESGEVLTAAAVFDVKTKPH